MPYVWYIEWESRAMMEEWDKDMTKYRITGIPKHEISMKRFSTTDEAWKCVDAAVGIPRGRLNVNVYCVAEEKYQPWMDEPDACLRGVRSMLARVKEAG
jgi:hypothetical protein